MASSIWWVRLGVCLSATLEGRELQELQREPKKNKVGQRKSRKINEEDWSDFGSGRLTQCGSIVVNAVGNGIEVEAALADGAARDARLKIAGFERLLPWLDELTVLVDRGQPVGGGRVVVVAPAVALALDERRRSEVLQTRAGRHQ